MNDFRGVYVVDYSEVNGDVVRTLKPSRGYLFITGILGLLVVAYLGLYYFMSKVGFGLTGANSPMFWVADMPAFVFWIGLAHGGTLLSAVLHITRSKWRNPIYRYAEAMTVSSILIAFLILLMHLGRPWRFFFAIPYPSLRGIWPSFRSPLVWDSFAIGAYAVGSILFLYLGMIPDLAAIRDQTSGWRHKLYKLLALGWRGTDNEWQHLRSSYLLMACLLTPLILLVSSVVAWDFVVSVVPGLHSTVYAPYFVTSALFSGVAAVIIVVILVRRFLKLKNYITGYHLDKLGQLLLALSLIWTYLNAVELWSSWFRNSTFESEVLLARTVGAYAPLFWLMTIFGTIVPLLCISRRIRTSTRSMLVIAALVNVAVWIERFIIIVPALARAHLPYAFGNYVPTIIELFIFVLGPFFLFALLMLLFVKLFPSVSMHEVKSLRVPRRSGRQMDPIVSLTERLHPRTMAGPVTEESDKVEHGE